AHTYGRKLEYTGPLYEGFEVEGSRIRIRFAHSEGLRAQADGKVLGFSIAGADKKFVWAEAKIEGTGVVVWSDSVSKPTAVRYGCADNPSVNLYNAWGLPASPFRPAP